MMRSEEGFQKSEREIEGKSGPPKISRDNMVGVRAHQHIFCFSTVFY